MLRFSEGHQADHDPVMEIDDFIGHGRDCLHDKGDHCCVTALRLKLREI